VPPGWQPGWPPPQRSGADIAVSVVMMVLTVLLLAGSGFMGLMSLAFLDYCPPQRCSVSGAVNSVVGALAVALFVAFGGMLLTVIRLATRKTAWPFAVGTLGACIGVLFCGAVAYSISVGG